MADSSLTARVSTLITLIFEKRLYPTTGATSSCRIRQHRLPGGKDFFKLHQEVELTRHNYELVPGSLWGALNAHFTMFFWHEVLVL